VGGSHDSHRDRHRRHVHRRRRGGDRRRRAHHPPDQHQDTVDAGDEFPAAINGQEQATYLDWMRSCFLITVTGCPAISVPAGFTREGWPVGIQIVAAPRHERLLLEVAHAFEQLTRVGDRRPPLTDMEETR
jgi:amidase